VLERVTKWARRHRSIVRAALGFLILAVFVLAGATLLIYQAKEEAEDALQGEKTARADLETQAKKLKDALKRETDARNALEIEQKKLRKEQENTRAALALEKQASYRQSIALANQEWWDGRASVAERLLNDCPQELCGWEWLYLKRLHMTAVRRLPDERRWYFWRSTMTADGTRLAAACADGFVYVWDTASGRELLKVAGPEPRVHTLTFSPDGRRLAAASGLWWIIQPMPSSTSIKVWDTVSGKELLTLDGQCHTIHQIAFSPDGQSIAAGGSDGMIRVIDAAKGKEIHVLAAHKGPVYAIAFLSDGKRLFSAGGDRRIRHWDLTTGLIAKDVAGPALGNTSAAFGRDGQLLALPASDNTVRIVSAFSGKELRSLHGHTNSVFKLAFSEDGALLASGSADQTVRIWDTATGQEKRVYRGHDGSVADLAFADQGRRLVSLSGDKFLRIWDTTLHQFVHVLEGHKGEVTALDFSPDSSRLASASADKSIRVWDIAARKALHVLTGHSERVEAVAFHPDGKRLASVANDQTVRLWDLTTGKESSRFEHPGRGKDWALAFQQDGKRLAFAAATGLGEIDLGEDKAVARFKPMDQGHRVVLSQDGRYLAVLALDTPTTLWDISSGRKLRPLGDSAKTWGGAFSRDGRLFASCHAPENPTIESEWFVRIVHTADGREIARLRAKQAAFVHLAFSPDASRIATGERDGARIWDARTGHELLRLRGLAGPIRHVVFSPDGRFLAGFDGKNLLLWDSGG
jgi:WD40 repeat protein